MIGARTTALSGLNSASKKLEATASNIANVSTIGALKQEDGAKPYTPITTTQESNGTGGVTTNFAPKTPSFIPTYDPDSPFADNKGIIGTPNVSLEEEAGNLLLAKYSYKANIATIKASDEMQDELMNIFDKDV